MPLVCTSCPLMAPDRDLWRLLRILGQSREKPKSLFGFFRFSLLTLSGNLMKTEENLLSREWRRVSAQLCNVFCLHADPVIGASMEANEGAAAFETAFEAFI